MFTANSIPCGGGGELRRLLSVLFLSWVLLLGTSVALAQEAEEGDDEAAAAEEAAEEETASAEPERDADDAVEEIIVTGSRIRRDAFTAALPVTVITADRSVLAGLTDAGEILQSSALASGTQIDNTFGAFVVSGGPGVNTFGLRSLDANRTLILVNNRRFTAAGVRGQVSNVDLNSIPGIAIQRIEILKDGASSVYGADAVAGVVNIITRKQFDELSVNFYGNEGQENYDASLSYGKTFDRGYFDFAVQFSRQDAIKRNKFDWSTCNERRRTGGGQFPSIFTAGEPDSPPTLLWTRIYDREIVDEGLPQYPGRCYGSNYGFVQVFDGVTNPWYGYDENSDFFDSGLPFFGELANSDEDYNLIDRSMPTNIPVQSAYRDIRNSSVEDLVSSERLLHLYADGAWDFDLDRIAALGALGEWLGSVTTSFDFFYTRRRNTGTGAHRQFFPSVSGLNPTNKIGNAAELNPLFAQLTRLIPPARLVNHIPQATLDDPDFDLLTAALADPDLLAALLADPALELGVPYDAQPTLLTYEILDPSNQAKVDTLAFHAGVEGDLGRFKWELFGGYSFSRGSLSYDTLLRDRLARALSAELDGNGELQCVINSEQLEVALDDDVEVADRIVAEGPDENCVPLDLFTADALLRGRLPEDAKEYITEYAQNKTSYDLFTLDFSTEGGLFELPAGEVRGVFGWTWRYRELDDRPALASAQNNQWGLISAGRTVGDDNVKEAFVEIEFPLLAGFALGEVSAAEELSLNISGRYTDYSSYGSDNTYRFLLNWAINPTARIRTSFGTSFRAPALYELYLNRQTGFVSGANDPCDSLGDNAEGTTIAANCEKFNIGIDSGFGASGLLVLTGGNRELRAETSESWTLGLVLTPSLTDWLPRLGVNVSMAFDFYDIDLENSISRRGVSNILSRCYSSENFEAPECALIVDFDPDDGGRDRNNQLNDINAQYINIATERSTGYDITLRMDREFSFGDLNVDVLASRLLAYQFRLTPVSDLEDYSGRHAYADWRGEMDTRLSLGDWSLLWRVRYVGETDEDPVWPRGAVRGEETSMRTNINVAKDVFYHTFSVNYEDPQERFEVILGVQNIFDQDPPSVGWQGFTPASATGVVYNIPVGAGYDIFPRRLYATVQYNF